MKFALKSLAAAAALAAASMGAHAAPQTGTVGQDILVSGAGGSGIVTLTGGAGQLAFSSGTQYAQTGDPALIGGLIGALNVGKVVVSAIAPATYAQTEVPDELGDPVRNSAKANAPVVSITADNVTGKILEVASIGGARQVGTRISGTLNGGRADVTNLRFDLANSVVYADLVGRSANVGTRPGADFVLTNQALWTIGNISGPTVLPPAALGKSDAEAISIFTGAGFTYDGKIGDRLSFSAVNVISGLKVTAEGFNFFKNSLALGPTGVDALNAVNNDAQGWGQVDSKITFTVVSVPEPTTYALTLTGLALVGAIAARRRRQG